MTDSSVQVGNVTIPGRVFLAPLAGFTDLPFRQICRKLGAAYAVAEMVASQKHLRESRKSQERFSLGSESYPRAIQLLGSDLRIWPTRPLCGSMRRADVVSTAAVRLKKFVRRVRLGSAKR